MLSPRTGGSSGRLCAGSWPLCPTAGGRLKHPLSAQGLGGQGTYTPPSADGPSRVLTLRAEVLPLSNKSRANMVLKEERL
jgi:hypothetical protein